MVAIHYLSELDKIIAFTTYRPIVADFSRDQLEIMVLLLVNGSELDYAFDMAMAWPKHALNC